MATIITNQIPNPSFETNPTSWAVNVAPETITRVTSEFLYGAASLQVVTTAAGAGQGGNMNAQTVLAANGEIWTISAHAKGAGTVRLRSRLRNSGNSSLTNYDGDPVTLTSNWQRLSFTFTITDATAHHLNLAVITTTAEVATFYIDGAMATLGSTLYDYFDGDTADTTQYLYDWVGTAHASASTRTELFNAGLRRIRNQFQLRPY